MTSVEDVRGGLDEVSEIIGQAKAHEPVTTAMAKAADLRRTLPIINGLAEEIQGRRPELPADMPPPPLVCC